MSRKCKTPAKVLELMEQQQSHMRWITDLLHTKRTVPLENQADHVKENTQEYWIGIARGINMMLEVALMAHKCYAGFSYQARLPLVLANGESYIPTIGPNDADYASWRVKYIARLSA